MLPLIAIAALTGSLIAPTPAADPAADGDIVCRGGTFTVRFSPGLTFSDRTVRLTADGDVGVCFSAAHPEIGGGRIHADASLTGKCPGPVGPGYARVTINWDNGTTSLIGQSTFRGSAMSFGFEGGSVTSGPFTGLTARANGRTTTNLIDLGAGCVLGGLTTYSAATDIFAIGEI